MAVKISRKVRGFIKMKILLRTNNKPRLVFLVLFFLYSFLTAVSQNEAIKPVKIGFLIQSEKSADAVKGAIFAASVINEQGGINGKPVDIVVKSMEGPWGTGAKQAVSVIFDDNVLAVIGFTDGRNGHLIEQACTKTGVLFISCYAADPTLAQAFIPWFFNCVPNDLQQTQILAEEIFVKNKYKKIAVITGKDYDSRGSLKYFNRITASYPQSKTTDIKFFDRTDDKAGIISKLVIERPDCILLFCNSEETASIAGELNKTNLKVPVYGNLYLAINEPDYLSKALNSDVKIKIPYFERSEKKYKWFSGKFATKYGNPPGIPAELAFDAISLLAESVRNSSFDRESLQNYLMKTSYEGVTGIISFDERGNRRGVFKILDF